MGKGGAMFTPNELLFTFGFFYVCANFGEHPSRNASVRVHADGHTDRSKLVFIICPILYAIAIGQIITKEAKFIDWDLVHQTQANHESVNAILT